MRICVYGASSQSIDKTYIDEIEKLGEMMVQKGHSLVFGGGANGLMGSVARGVRMANGHIIGVIPSFFRESSAEIEYNGCDKLIRTDTMRERKKIMEEYADAFIMVPGGIGTFEEFFEILTLKQLDRLDKPLVIYNLDGYFDEMCKMINESIKKNFIHINCLKLFKVCSTCEEIFEYIGKYEKHSFSVKDLKDG